MVKCGTGPKQATLLHVISFDIYYWPKW